LAAQVVVVVGWGPHLEEVVPPEALGLVVPLVLVAAGVVVGLLLPPLGVVAPAAGLVSSSSPVGAVGLVTVSSPAAVAG
jgi:hypothetical protein